MFYLIGLFGMFAASAIILPELPNSEESNSEGSEDSDAIRSGQYPDKEMPISHEVLEKENDILTAHSLEEGAAGPECPMISEAIINGTKGNDILIGSEGSDEIYAGEGNDTSFGDAGDDIIESGKGDDLLHGNAGNDALHARGGDDMLNGGEGEDSLFGGDGNDTLEGGDSSKDFLSGGDGDDQIFIGEGDRAHGGAGGDMFVLKGSYTEEASEFLDFNPEEDVLAVVVDSVEGDSWVSIQVNETENGYSELCLNGLVVALLPSEDMPSVDQIVILMV